MKSSNGNNMYNKDWHEQCGVVVRAESAICRTPLLTSCSVLVTQLPPNAVFRVALIPMSSPTHSSPCCFNQLSCVPQTKTKTMTSLCFQSCDWLSILETQLNTIVFLLIHQVFLMVCLFVCQHLSICLLLHQESPPWNGWTLAPANHLGLTWGRLRKDCATWA